MLIYTGFEQKPAACKVLPWPLLDPPQAQNAFLFLFNDSRYRLQIFVKSVCDVFRLVFKSVYKVNQCDSL